MKLVVLLAFTALASFAQATFTPPVPATAAVPGKLSLVDSAAGAGAITCTITGNAVPATAVSIACTAGAQTIPAYSVPFVPSMAFTFALNLGSNSVGAILTMPATATGIQVQADVHAASPQTLGSF